MGVRPYGASADATRATRVVTARIRAALGVSPAAANSRFFMVTTMVVHAAADHEALVSAGTASPAVPSADELADDLVSAALAIFSATA